MKYFTHGGRGGGGRKLNLGVLGRGEGGGMNDIFHLFQKNNRTIHKLFKNQDLVAPGGILNEELVDQISNIVSTYLRT